MKRPIIRLGAAGVSDGRNVGRIANPSMNHEFGTDCQSVLHPRKRPASTAPTS
jgi:hypothetical protein